MEAPGVAVTGAHGRTWRGTDLGWGALLLAALFVPSSPLASAFNATYGATADEIMGGAWILKLSLAALAVAGMAVGRIPALATGASPSVERVDGRATAILAALLVLALGLRLTAIGAEMWMDEIYLRTRYAPLEFRQLVSTYDSQNHQPFYSILARVAWLASGGADWSIRIPAVLFGVGSLAALWWYARRVTSRAEALLAVAFLAVSYHHVWFSQNARGYTAILLFALLSTGVFQQLCADARNPRALAWSYALLMALATWTHLTAALIAVGHMVALLLTTRWTAEGRRSATWPAVALALSALLTIVLYAPMLPQVWHLVSAPTMEGFEVEWTGAGWMLGEAVRVLSRGVPGGIVTALAALGVLGVGVASYWRQSRRTTLLMFLPVLVTFAVIVAARHNLWPRFFFFAAGFFVLAAMRGGFVVVRSIIPRHGERVAVVFAGALACLSLVTVPRAWQPKQQFRAAFDFIQGSRQAGDAVVVLDEAAIVYSLRGWARDWRTAADLETLTSIEGSARRTWIVYILPERLRAISPALYQELTSPRYEVVRVFPATVGGGEIHVLRHDSATGND